MKGNRRFSFPMDARLIEYFKICSITAGGKSHPLDIIPKEHLLHLMTESEMGLFFIKRKGKLVAKESIIGGNEEKNNIHIDKIAVFSP